jgi:eukaryotic-like serine/threonine-protein kinase
MTGNTVRGYTLTRPLCSDGRRPYVGVSPDGLPVFVRLFAALILDETTAETVLQFLSRYRQLNHPSLIKVRDSWIEERHLALVTDFADGGCLRNRLRQQGPVGGRELVSLFTRLAVAIDFLHRHGIRHGDISPANLLLHRDVPLLDVPRLWSNKFGVTVKPAYTAPEVVRREESEQSDQYSLAASYTQLRLGRPIVLTNHLSDRISTMTAFLEGDPDLEPWLDGERDVLLKALAKDPVQRYPTCLTFVQELGRVVDRRGAL